MKWFFFGMALANIILSVLIWRAGGEREIARTDSDLIFENSTQRLMLLKEAPVRPEKRASVQPAKDDVQKNAPGAEQDEALRPTLVPASVPAPAKVEEVFTEESPDRVERMPVVTCLRLEAIATEKLAARTKASLQRDGAKNIRMGTELRLAIFTQVYLPPATSTQEAARTMDKLRRSGVRDIYHIRTGEKANAISLGVFSTETAVARRIRELQKTGYEPSTEKLERMAAQWWLEFDWQKDSLETWLPAAGIRPQPQPADCR